MSLQKILFLTHSFLGNNVPHGVGIIIHELCKNNKSVVVDRDFSDSYSIQEKNYDKIKKYTLTSPYPQYDIMKDHNYIDQNLVNLLRTICDKEKFDIIHIHHLLCWPTNVVDFLKSLRIPIILSVHDTWYLCPTVNYYNRFYDKICSKDIRTPDNCLTCLKVLAKNRFDQDHEVGWLKCNILEKRSEYLQVFDKVDAVIYPTIKYKNMYFEEGFIHYNSKIIHHFIDIPSIQKIVNDDFIFSFIGNIGFGKGVDTLIDAFIKLPYENVRLRIYGEIYDGSIKNKIDNSIDPRIEYIGPYEFDKLPNILSLTDAVVVPSFYPESFNLCSYASIKTGTMLVVSDAAYHSEFLNEHNCIVFEAKNVNDLRLKLDKIYNDKKIRILCDVEENYFSKKYSELYSKLRNNLNIECNFIFLVRSLEDIEDMSKLRIKFKNLFIIYDNSVPMRQYDLKRFVTERVVIKKGINEKNVVSSIKSCSGDVAIKFKKISSEICSIEDILKEDAIMFFKNGETDFSIVQSLLQN